MRFSLMFLFTLVICTFAQAQTGPCTEKAVKQGNLPFAADAFSFDAVMLNVFKAKGAACQQVAGTMHPLEDTVK
jgi:hypothetical protein